MKNAVNSVKISKDNTEPSLVGNYLEGVTTRVEPKAKAMAIITHSTVSNPVEKRSAPDNKGDDIVWSTQRCAESSRNDLTAFGEFSFNMAGTAIGNQVIKLVSRFPITVKRNIGEDMVNIKSLPELRFGQSAKLASIRIALARLRGLLAPVLALVSLAVALVSPVVGASPKCSTSPNMTLLGTILAGSFGAKVSKGFAAVKASFCNWANVAGVVLAGVDITAKFQKAFAAASLFGKRPLGERGTANNTGLEFLLSRSIAFPGTVFAILLRDLLAANCASSHG